MPAATAEETLFRFTALTNHLQDWFYEPDLEALEIALSAATAHYHIQSDPVWLFVVGTSGSGKTSIIIESLSSLPNTFIIGTLSRKTLISGRKKEGGLLYTMGKSAIMLMKDFTTFMSMRSEDRAEIASQLREVYDGKWSKATGMQDDLQTWEGKVTTIAAATPAIEREWALMRDLGERFLTVRLPRVDGPESARSALAQRGHEHEIKERIHKLTRAFVDPLTLEPAPHLPSDIERRLMYLGELVAISRTRVIRESSGSHAVIEVCSSEQPTRVTKGMGSVMANYAALMRREPEPEDFRLPLRLAFDCIPHARAAMLRAVPPDGSWIAWYDMAQLGGLLENGVAYHGPELVALGLLRSEDSAMGIRYAASPKLIELMSKVNPEGALGVAA